MDKIHILEQARLSEKINDYDGQNVHVQTRSGASYTGQLNVRTSIDAGLDEHRSIEIGWRQEPVEINNILEIRPT